MSVFQKILRAGEGRTLKRMQERVRETYMTLAHASNWIIFDGERSKELIAEDVFRSVTSRLGPL